MIAFLLVVYTGLVLVLFKLKIVKPRPFPIACMVVVGVLALGGVVVAWSLCAPMSPRVVVTQYVVQIVPYVKGQVKKIHAQPNQPLKKGELLLEIDPAPYQFAVDQLQAALETARYNVKQSGAGVEAAKANVPKSVAAVAQAEAGVTQAKAGVAKAQAGVTQAKAAVADAQAGVVRYKAAAELAKSEEDIALDVVKNDAGAVSKLKLTQLRDKRREAEAAVKQADAGVSQAQASQEQAEAGVGQARANQQQAEAAVAQARFGQQQAEAAERQAEFSLKMAQSKVPGVEAQLKDARFNLEQCRVLAPADGFVVNWQVREGTMIVPMPMAPAGTFIDTSETFIVAVFPQNYLMNVRPGNEVEMALDPFPGRLVMGQVDTVVEATGEGQFTTGGVIPQAAKVGSHGLLAVKIRLAGDDRGLKIPLGAGGTVAIYTGEGQPVHIISKVAIRMKKWMAYVVPS